MKKYLFLLFAFLYYPLNNTMESTNQQCSEHKIKNIKKIGLKTHGLKKTLDGTFTIDTLPTFQKIIENYMSNNPQDTDKLLVFFEDGQHVFHCDVAKRELCCDELNMD